MTKILKNSFPPLFSRPESSGGYFFAAYGRACALFFAAIAVFKWIYLRVQPFKVVFNSLKINKK